MNSSPDTKEIYRLAVLKIIRQIYSLSNRTKVDGEMNEDSRIWTRILYGVVPLEYLQAIFERACRTMKNSFAPNAFDLNKEWQNFQTEQAAAARKKEEEERIINRVKYCPQSKYHIDEEGMTLVCNPFNFNEEIKLPCLFCRPQAYEAARVRFIKKHGKPNPLKTLENVAQGNFGK